MAQETEAQLAGAYRFSWSIGDEHQKTIKKLNESTTPYAQIWHKMKPPPLSSINSFSISIIPEFLSSPLIDQYIPHRHLSDQSQLDNASPDTETIFPKV